MRVHFVYRLLLPNILAISAIAAQKPVVTTTLHAENRNRMQTFEELWTAATLVVEGRFETSRPIDFATSPNFPPTVQTSFDVRVLEVFKPDARVTKQGVMIEVRKGGGDRDRGSYIERIVSDDFPMYVVGERYILFLREHILPATVFYSPEMISAEGVFKIAGTQAETPGKRDLARQLAQRGPDGLRQMLRERRGRQ